MMTGRRFHLGKEIQRNGPYEDVHKQQIANIVAIGNCNRKDVGQTTQTTYSLEANGS